MLGISRTFQAVIEQGHDADGIIWPWPVAPYHVLICVLDPQLPEAMDAVSQLVAAAEKAGADVLVDDRRVVPATRDLVLSQDPASIPIADGGSRAYAVVAVRLLEGLVPPEVLHLTRLSVDGSVLAYTLVVTALTVLGVAVLASVPVGIEIGSGVKTAATPRIMSQGNPTAPCMRSS